MQVRPESRLHSGKGLLQRGGVLFAEGVQVQPLDALRQRGGKFRARDAETGERCAGVVDGVPFLR